MIYCPGYHNGTRRDYYKLISSSTSGIILNASVQTDNATEISSLLPAEWRVIGEYIHSSTKRYAGGDRSCSHDQFIATVTPKRVSDQLYSSAGFGSPVYYDSGLMSRLNSKLPSYWFDWSGPWIGTQPTSGGTINLYFEGISAGYFLLSWNSNNNYKYYYITPLGNTALGFAYVLDFIQWSPYMVNYSCSVCFRGSSFSHKVSTVYYPTSAQYGACSFALEERTNDPLGIHSTIDRSKIVPIANTSDLRMTHTVDYDPNSLSEFNQVLLRQRLDTVFANIQLMTQRRPVKDVTWGELARNAINACKSTDVNSLAYIKDLKSTFSEIRDILLLIKNPTNLKQWSKTWLGLRYGTRLTVADTMDLIKSASKMIKELKRNEKRIFNFTKSSQSNSMTSSSKIVQTWTRELYYKVYYTPSKSALNVFCKNLFDWGLYPSLYNLWDLIPLSFVADWVVNIQKALQTLDTLDYQRFVDIIGTTYTHKDTIQVMLRLSDLGFEDVTGTAILYHRGTSPTLHKYGAVLNWGSPSGINLIDAIALYKAR